MNCLGREGKWCDSQVFGPRNWEDDEPFSETRMTLRNRSKKQVGTHLSLNIQALETERPMFKS